jgi:hypothetical protein
VSSHTLSFSNEQNGLDMKQPRPEMANHPLTVAARDNDDLSEIDFKSSIRQAGLEPEDALYVAEQRALRCVLTFVRKMSPDQIRAFSTYQTFKLSEYELYLYHMFTSCELDGMLIGWRAKQEQEKKP